MRRDFHAVFILDYIEDVLSCSHSIGVAFADPVVANLRPGPGQTNERSVWRVSEIDFLTWPWKNDGGCPSANNRRAF